jgi:hypothetical protein
MRSALAACPDLARRPAGCHSAMALSWLPLRNPAAPADPDAISSCDRTSRESDASYFQWTAQSTREGKLVAKYVGRCACEAVKFEFELNGDPGFVANCHCLDCKKASGGEMATFFAVPANDFTLVSGTPKAFVYIANSGKRLSRRFCAECGSRLYTSDLESFPGTVFVQLGSLDQPDVVAPKVEMFTRRRVHWNPPLDLPQFEGMPS